MSFKDLTNFERALKDSAFTHVCGNCGRRVTIQSENQQCPECGLGPLKEEREGK